MKQVAPLCYGVIFKKAFGQVDIFKAFVKDIIGIDLEIDKVETEKKFTQQIGNIKVEFDCYAEDKKNRVINIKRTSPPLILTPKTAMVNH